MTDTREDLLNDWPYTLAEQRRDEANAVEIAARIMGRKGGQSRSPAKQAAVRKNGKKGGRPTTVAALSRIEQAAGAYRCSATNPTGLAAYYDENESLPWRIADDSVTERYRTAREAERAARQWAKEMAR